MSRDSPDASVPMVRADPRHRKLVAVAIGVIFLLTVGMAAVLYPVAEAWVEAYEAGIADRSLEELSADYRLITWLTSVGAALPLVLMGSVILYQAYRVHRAKQYPYPRMMLLRDVPLETGAAARRRFKLLLSVGVALLVSAGFAGWFVFTLLMGLIDSL